MKAELGLPELAIEWVPVTLEDRFSAVAQGKIDLLCGSATETLERRKQVSFSLPIFPSGTAALLRADAPAPLQDVLAGRPAVRTDLARLSGTDPGSEDLLGCGRYHDRIRGLLAV